MSVGGPRDSRRVPPTRPLVRMPPTRPERVLREEPVRPYKPNRMWTAAIGGLVIVYGLLAGYDLVVDRHAVLAKPVASTSIAHSAKSKPTALGANGAPSSVITATAHPSPSATARARVLAVLSAQAFGPDGTADGDNPGIVSRVLTADTPSPWESQWYATPDFGKLQAGTGLLLDMGRVVSVSSVRLVLGESVGADVELLVGDNFPAAPGGLTTVAAAYDVGGTVHLPLKPSARARYVLVWFTRLPPDPAGTYMVNVYSVTVDGRP